MSEIEAELTPSSQAATQEFRCSPQQRRLWVLELPASSQRLCCAVDIEGPLDSARLRNAVDEVAKAHEILKANLTGLPNGTPVANANGGIVWDDPIDLSALSAAERQEKLEQAWSECTWASPDPEFGPPIRLRLASWQSGHRLFISLSPLLGDRSTLGLLVQAIAQAYEAGENDYSYGGLQYAKFAEWQNGLIETPDPSLDEARAFWQEKASKLTATVLPAARDLPSFPGFLPEVVSLSLDADMANSIAMSAALLGVSETDFLFAAWCAFLWRWSRGENCQTGFVSSGRSSIDELKGLMGLVARCLPIQVDIDGAMPFGDFVGAIQNKVQAALEWEDYFLFASLSPNSGAPASLDLAFEYSESLAPIAAGALTWTLSLEEVIQEPFKLKLGCRRTGEKLDIEL
ncbi:MAG TPA: condensation domain-containing protein, partial [Capsulimonadaceae bacterium]|nr:condensation domain-containing protein [Capsulimonadaceae bacterium]